LEGTDTSSCDERGSRLFVAHSHRLAAQLPDDAIGPMATVKFRIAAGDARLKAVFTVTVFKLVTKNFGGNVRMKAALLLVVTHLDKSQAHAGT